MSGPHEDWATVNALFHAALEQPDAERAAWLDAHCRDARLRSEVESLLAAHARAGDFLAAPAGNADALLQDAASADHWSPGALVGPYRVRRLLGEGGMGVVYLGEDTRLGRVVALKVLPRRFAADPARRERLRREARAAAALAHPGIATIYALEDVDGQLCIAAEYVEGVTLRDELDRGPMPLPVALDTAVAIARALAAAHDRGIVHRDLKPENVMRATTGEVKVLDFGLARFTDPTAPTTAALTRDGVLVGTPSYMSPEQIRGDEVDARSDLFALGVLLYEMVTGVHPFGRGPSPSVLARVLEDEPPPLVLATRPATGQSGIARAVEAVALACLRKRPAQRYRTAHEVVAALEAVRSALQSGASPSLPRPAPGDAGPGAATPGAARAPASALWWWQFHQLAAAIADAGLVVPLWMAQRSLPGRWLLAVAIAGLVSAIAAIAIRLHLWFASRHYADDAREILNRSAGLLRLTDGLFAACLLAAGTFVVSDRTGLGASLIGAAAAIVVAFAVIEPAAMRAAFRPTRNGS